VRQPDALIENPGCQILFAERDNRLVDPIARRRRPRTFAGLDEEGPARILAELMTEDAKATGRVPKPPRGFLRRQPFDEIGPQGFILPMDSVDGFQEPLGDCRYRFC